MDKHFTRVTVRHFGTMGNSGPVPDTIDSMIAALTKARDEIPEEYRSETEVYCDPDYSHGDYFDAMTVVYSRPETGDEKAARLAQEKAEWEYQLECAKKQIERVQSALARLS